MMTGIRESLEARFRNAPIRQKLLITIISTTTLALVLAGMGIVLLDSYLFRQGMAHDLAALANIVADNSSGALAFDDAQAARETLAALRERPHMVTACLFKPTGALFARYSRPGATTECPSPRPAQQIWTTPEGLAVSRPVIAKDRQEGTLVMLYDRAETGERVRLYGVIVLGILIGSSIIAFAFSSKLRDTIAIPISRLASAASSVSANADYSVRVQKDWGDELGVLIATFNEMLTRIQSRDAEIQNAKDSLEITLSSIGDAVISTSADGRVVFANPVAQTLLKRPVIEIVGRPVDDVFRIISEASRLPMESPVTAVLREGRMISTSNTTLLLASNGTEIPIDESAAPIKQNGKTTGVVLVFRDVTERRGAQQAAAYLASIVESSDEAIIGTTPDGTIRTWNIGAERIYGHKAEEVIGRTMADLLPPDRKHEESDILERVCRGMEVVRFETVRTKKDGTSIDVSLTISPIRDKAGHIVGVSHMARDITEQKRIAEQMRQTQKLESLGVLAGGIAHDFNNLLTGIMGNASLAQLDLPEESSAYNALGAVISASERAAQLAQQMLAYSGKGRFVIERLELSARVRDTLPLIRAAIPPAIELTLQLQDNLPEVDADPAQLQQVIMNIIINGAEAIPDGTPGSVTIRTALEELGPAETEAYPADGVAKLKPGRYVRLEVSDTGAGMDEKTRTRIFDPFFTTKFTGRGLGLAAVLGIVRGHKGSIQVISAPGQGTTISILFPAAESVPGKRSDAIGESIDDAGRGGLVLVVDDEPFVVNFASQALERAGYQTLEAENGSRGVELFRKHSAELKCVLLDLTMPVMNGEAALEQMRAIRAEVPVILTSGFHEMEAVQRFEGKGLAGFLQKPYKAATLVQKIDAVVSAAKTAA